MFKQSESHADQAACVASLVASVESLRVELDYSDQDARSVALNNIRTIAYATQMTLNLLDSWTIGNEVVRQAIPQVLGLREVTEKSVEVAGNSLHKTSKLGLALLGQFQIENCLRCIAEEMELPEAGGGFYTLAKALLDELGLATSELGTLNTPAMIRNSLHSNGIHRGYGEQDTVVTVKGVTYDFRHGERVSCASVEHVAHALEASIEVLGKICKHPRVLALEDPLFEHYVWEITTQSPHR